MNPCGKGLDSEKLHDELIIGAGYMAKGARNFGDWTMAMSKEFGPEIRPYLNDMYARSKATYDAAMQPLKMRARDIRTEKRGLEYRGKVLAGDFAKNVREKLPITGESFAKQKAFEDARDRFEQFVRAKERENQPPMRRLADKAVALARWSKLTGVETLGKIFGAATVRIAQRTVESAANEALRHLPVIGKIVKGAGSEGAGLAELPAYYKGVVQGYKDIPGVLKGSISSRERLYSSPFSGTVTKILDRTSVNLHAAGKRPAYQGAYEHAKTYLTKEAQALGKDLSNPEVISQIDEAAKAAGNRSIFLRDNAASKALSVLTNYLEKQKLAPTAGFIASKVLRFLLPIVRVPTNIASETLSMSGGGLITGTFKTARVMKKGLELASPEEKASILRSYRNGMIGTGLFMTGFFLKDHFARPYDSRHPYQQGELRENEVKVMGVTVPRWLMHAPPLLVMQAGADTAHFMEAKFGKNGQSAPVAYGLALQRVIRDVPFIREVSTIDSMIGGGWQSSPSKELGKQLQGVIPQALQNIAKWTDEHDDEGYPVQRKPETIPQQLEMGVPGLRQNVPLRERKTPIGRIKANPTNEFALPTKKGKTIKF